MSALSFHHTRIVINSQSKRCLNSLLPPSQNSRIKFRSNHKLLYCRTLNPPSQLSIHSRSWLQLMIPIKSPSSKANISKSLRYDFPILTIIELAAPLRQIEWDAEDTHPRGLLTQGSHRETWRIYIRTPFSAAYQPFMGSNLAQSITKQNRRSLFWSSW